MATVSYSVMAEATAANCRLDRFEHRPLFPGQQRRKLIGWIKMSEGISEYVWLAHEWILDSFETRDKACSSSWNETKQQTMANRTGEDLFDDLWLTRKVLIRFENGRDGFLRNVAFELVMFWLLEYYALFTQQLLILLPVFLTQNQLFEYRATGIMFWWIHDPVFRTVLRPRLPWPQAGTIFAMCASISNWHPAGRHFHCLICL